MANEEMVGGLMSALSRGDSLENAMMTFYNAGYKKEDIEESAKAVYSKLGPEGMKLKGSLQDTLKSIAIKAGVEKKSPPKVVQGPNPNKNQVEGKTPLDEKDNAPKDKNKSPQNIPDSMNNKNNYDPSYKNADDIANKIVTAIKGLKQISIPSRIEIVSRNIDSKPQAIQRASDYSREPPKSVSKVATYILVSLLILLLGILSAVIFFKEDLIKVFNNLGLG